MTYPVEERIGEIRRHLAANRAVVLTAPPGSGKTTCVPPALLGEPWLAGKKIVMLEPRRLAARNCAAYMARRRGEPVGATVGYQVRLERKVSQATRLEVVTEGLLAQRLLSDPELKGVGLVIFDEFHERALPCDLAFALALDVRRALRPDLRIMVMSATLDAAEVAAHLGDAEVVRAEGRMFPVETRYLGDVSVEAAIARAQAETGGDILVFLPGEGEIRRVNEHVPEALPLYGSLPKEEQDRVFEPGGRRKVILSTSIAETSVTVEGVTCVIDSGLMRIPRFSPSTGMSGLVTLPLSRDRAEQRRGRAGRVRPGVCYRLWTEGGDLSRPPKMTPEILDADLASLVLSSAAWGALRRDGLPWLTMPPAASWSQAEGLLRQLGALGPDGRLTRKGERMSSMPMHPRLANMILGGGDPMLAAVLEEGGRSRETDIRYVPRTGRIRELAKRFSRRGDSPPAAWGQSPGGVGTGPAAAWGQSPGGMLALAYPDRIAKNRGNGTFIMTNGRGAFLPTDDPLATEPYIVACRLDDRQGDARVFLGCPILEAEILDLFGDRVVEERTCAWDRRNDCVKSVRRGMLGEMPLYEKPVPAAEGAERAMLEGVRVKGVANLPCWTKESLQFRARMNFLHRVCPQDGWPAADDAAILAALEGFVGGMTKWRDLERLDVVSVMESVLAQAGRTRRDLDRMAPPRFEMPSGRRMTVHYEGDEPTVEVRLQECFGMTETPKVAGGRVPVVMTLLSPAQRPIQVTKDLAGFWRGAYQLVRKEMRGRYPKHFWPEDPSSLA
ncbi:MAG: ATP-dependent helicase HrpB [Kiritimatiellae bacterium]|nr:ATP-dependent helicase HrpB [Kiritimatiellia bacterium]